MGEGCAEEGEVWCRGFERGGGEGEGVGYCGFGVGVGGEDGGVVGCERGLKDLEGVGGEGGTYHLKCGLGRLT